MGPFVPFLIWLICVGATALLVGFFIKNGGLDFPFTFASTSTSSPLTEGFLTEVVVPNITISTCPTGSMTYIDAAGNTNCCQGDIVNGGAGSSRCNGTTICSLSTNSKHIKTCSQWMNDEWSTRNLRLCPTSMPNYYGTMARNGPVGTEGCSTLPCSTDGTMQKSSNPNVQKCTIYSNQADEYSKLDSCQNVKDLDALRLPTNSGTTSAVKKIIENGQSEASKPANLQVNYTPIGQPKMVTCYDRARHMIINPNATTDANDVYFCDASYAFYIDKTLSADKAVGLPAGFFNSPKAKA